jgi:hypothetical protein
MDAFEIAQDVEVQRTRLQVFRKLLAQPFEMPVGRRELEISS